MDRPGEVGKPEWRPGARSAARLAASCFVVGLAWRTAVALPGAGCLPDLNVLADAATESGVRPQGPACGDGLIDVDAGEECDPGDAGDLRALGCSACRVACDGGAIDPTSKHCYATTGPAFDYQSAIESCENVGGHVVTFSGDEEVDRVQASALTANAPFWVGLKLDPGVGYRAAAPLQPGFSPPGPNVCSGCFGRTLPDSGVFGTLDRPPSLDAPCVISPPDGAAWFASSCQLDAGTYAVLCEREPAGRLGRGGRGTQGSLVELPGIPKQYLLAPDDLVTADRARQACELYGTAERPGSLAVFDSRDERERLAAELVSAARDRIGITTYWIGLARREDRWSWDDGRSESERPSVWGDRQPTPAPPQGPSSGEVSRAVLRIGSSRYDSQLAYAVDVADPNAVHAYICQR